jgi:hypothetical protein
MALSPPRSLARACGLPHQSTPVVVALLLLALVVAGSGLGCRFGGRTAAAPPTSATTAEPAPAVSPSPTEDIAVDEVRLPDDKALNRPLIEQPGTATGQAKGPLTAQQALEAVARHETVRRWDEEVQARRAKGEQCETVVSLAETKADSFRIRVHVQTQGDHAGDRTLGWFQVDRVSGEISQPER